MYRYGDRESHSYIAYAGFNKHLAIVNGEDQKDYRGNKYDFEVVSFIPDVLGSRKTVYKLDEYRENIERIYE
jgi:hypothetical protein